MKKLLYIGHDYHLKTKSNLFFIEILEEEYEISYVSYDPYAKTYKGVEEAKQITYDVLLAWQIMPEIDFLRGNFVFEQGISVPMYDSIANTQYDPWPEYREFKIICFSRTLHEQLIRRGYRAYYIQYFPQPYDHIDFGSDKSVFFWQRMQMIDFKVVERLLKYTEIDHIHLHKALDPGQKFTEPDGSLAGIISYSEWFENPSDMHNLMMESALYIAPRLYEGIGMSFLEAMAMGRCVIASDTPTMNEYITDGVNGILYDLDDVQPISAKNVKEIQKKAYESICKGYEKWQKEKSNILKWISEEMEYPLVTIVTVERDVINAGRQEAFKQCLESVHKQLYPNIQHLVIDGASQDGTISILEKYRKLGWIEYFSEEDAGMYEAMNKGIRLAKGKYIAFLNTDDYFHNANAIWESVYSLENSGADFSFASNRLLSEEGICDSIRKPEIGSFVAQMPFCHQTMFTSKKALEEIGMFNERYKSSADYDLVLRIILAGYKYVEVEQDIVTYRNGGISESMEERSNIEKREIFRRVYRKYYTGVDSEEFASRLAGRICPMELLENLKKAVSAELAMEIDNAVIGIDAKRQECLFPEEIIEFTEKRIVDRTYFNEGGREEQLIKMKRKEERLNKFVKYFALMDRWLWLKLQNKNISDYFKKRNYNKIAIYGFGEVGNRLYEDLSRFSDVKVLYAIDRGEKKNTAVKVYGLDDEFPEADVIVVSVNFIYDQIQSMLKEKTNIPIVSIDDVIFDIE